jgi:hypothetical protein
MEERVALELLIEKAKKEAAVFDAEFDITRQIIRDKGAVSKAYVESICDSYGISTSRGSYYYSQLWDFLHRWYYTNRR